VNTSFAAPLLLFLRALALLAPLPFGGAFASLLTKTACAALLAYIAAPAFGAAPIVTCRAVLSELLIGALLALPCALAVETAALFADLMETGRGANFSLLYDPLSQGQGSQLAVLARSWSAALLLTSGMAHGLIAAFAEAARLLPPGSGAHSLLLRDRGLQLIETAALYLTGATWFYLPCALVFLVVDSCIGAAARLSPRLGLSQEALPLKTYAAILVLLALNAAGAGDALVECSRPLAHLAAAR